MVRLTTELSKTFRRLEEAVEAIYSLTDKVRKEIEDGRPGPSLRPREDLLLKLFPEGLPVEKLTELPHQNGDGTEDKRRHRRVALVQEVECEADFGVFRRHLADISVGGMFIDIPKPLPLGKIITVRFNLINSGEPIVATAEVVYVHEKVGMGVKFLDLKPEDRERIKQLVEGVSCQKSSLGDEFMRRPYRVNVNIPVTLKITRGNGWNGDEAATIVALSKNGACITTDARLEAGAIVYLTTQKVAEFKASVIWVGSDTNRARIQCRGLAQAFGIHFP